jgi:hypothetical protein
LRFLSACLYCKHENMAKSITVNTKKRGRPAGQEFPVSVQVRLNEKQAAALDALVKAQGATSRSDGIRRLLDGALPAKKAKR